jgi:nucleoside-diphosphate-sugar epimerase
MVYGPRSAGWTIAMLKLVKRGVPVLFGEAQGHAYPIYVDDLVDLLVLAGTRPEAAGQAWNGADTPITWEQFFDFYAKMTGKKPRRVPLWLARGIAGANQLLHLGIPLTVDRLDTYVRRFRFVNTKAERVLGWKPKVPLHEGMHRSAEWLRQKGMLPFNG